MKKIKSTLKDSKRILVVVPLFENHVGIRIYGNNPENSLSIQVKLSELEKELLKVGVKRNG